MINDAFKGNNPHLKKKLFWIMKKKSYFQFEMTDNDVKLPCYKI